VLGGLFGEFQAGVPDPRVGGFVPQPSQLQNDCSLLQRQGLDAVAEETFGSVGNLLVGWVYPNNGTKRDIESSIRSHRSRVGAPVVSTAPVPKRDPAGPLSQKGFSAIYGWASDLDGIRHANMGRDRPPTEAEARVMLVMCSAYVNYLLSLRGSDPG